MQRLRSAVLTVAAGLCLCMREGGRVGARV
jgi:hypothetical protein